MSKGGIIVQARMGSSRLPGKVMKDLAGKPALDRLFERLRRVKAPLDIILATSTLPADDLIAAHIGRTPDIKLWRGSEQDVLKRYADAARHYDIDPVIRVTADCPLIEPGGIDDVLQIFLTTRGCDYADNVTPRLIPHGYGVQVVSREILERLDRETTSPHDREHVLVHIQDNPGKFCSAHVTPKDNGHPELRLTLDYPEDLALIQVIYERLYAANPEFGFADILALRSREPELFELNKVHVAHG